MIRRPFSIPDAAPLLRGSWPPGVSGYVQRSQGCRRPLGDEPLQVPVAPVPQHRPYLPEGQVLGLEKLQGQELEKVPGIAETLDWVQALFGFDLGDLRHDPERVQASLVCLLKTERDLKTVTREVTERLIGRVA